MHSLLKYRNKGYFEKNSDDYFLFETLKPMRKVSILLLESNTYWFDCGKMQLKATTTPCVAFSELKGTLVHYKNYPMIQGRVGGFGVKNSQYLYVFWTKLPMFDENNKMLGMPCALPHNYDIELR